MKRWQTLCPSTTRASVMRNAPSSGDSSSLLSLSVSWAILYAAARYKLEPDSEKWESGCVAT
eukprot:3049748-Amphidinium_carterae.1